MKRVLICAAVAAWGVLLGAASVAHAANVLPPDATVAGKAQAELSADWWKYVFSVPLDDSPVADQTGGKASIGQSGPVFFLVGSFSINGVPAVFPSTATRSITITDDKSLFFPVVNTWIDNLGVDPPLTEDQLRASAAQAIAGVTNLHASIDAMDVPDITSHRQMSPVFTYHIPNDNLFTAFGFNFSEQDVTGAVADGYYLALDPLSAGDHVINFGGGVGDLATETTYNIHVTSTGTPIPLPAAAWAALVALPAAALAGRRMKATH